MVNYDSTDNPKEQKNKASISKSHSFSPPSHRSLFQLLPVLVLLFAVVVTVKLTETKQNIRQNAASNVYTIPSSIDATGNNDASSALNAFIASVPNGSTISFSPNATYLLSQGLQFANRNNLELQGNGTTLKTISSAAGSNQLSSPFVLGHTYNGNWNDNNNNITIHDFTLVGNNPNPGVFTSGQEGESGMEIEGTNNLTIYNMTIKGVWSDGFKIGDASNNVRIYNSHVVDAGRNGVSTISGSNIEVDHNVFDKIGYVIFDVEPNTSSESNTYQNFHDNTFGIWGAEFFALDGSHTGALIHDITVNNNAGTGRSLLTFVNNGGTARNTNIVFTNNKSGIAATGPVLNFSYVNGLTVTGNVQPLTSGSLSNISNSTAVNLTPTPTRISNNTPTPTPSLKPTPTPISPTPKLTSTPTPTPIATSRIPLPSTNLSAVPYCNQNASLVTYKWNQSFGATYYLISWAGEPTINTGNVTSFAVNPNCTTGPGECSFNYNMGISWIVNACNSSGCSPASSGPYYTSANCVGPTPTKALSPTPTSPATVTPTKALSPTPTPTIQPTPTPVPPKNNKCWRFIFWRFCF